MSFRPSRQQGQQGRSSGKSVQLHSGWPSSLTPWPSGASSLMVNPPSVRSQSLNVCEVESPLSADGFLGSIPALRTAGPPIDASATLCLQS